MSLPDALTGQIIDLKEKREHEEYRKRVAKRNQRLAEIAGKHPHLFNNPTALELMLQGLEAQEGMA